MGEGPNNQKEGNGKKIRAVVIILTVFLIIIALGARMWVRSKTHITTDNAFIESNIYTVSSRIPGTVKNVYVNDNQPVKKGELLLELDPRDFEVRALNAKAQLDMAKNETSSDYAQVEAAKASVRVASARLEQAELDLKRGQALYEKEVIPKENLERLFTAHKMALAQHNEAEETLKRAEAVLGSTNPNKGAKILQRRAQLQEAELNLDYVKIYAPADGYITKKAIETGDIISQGQPIMAVVSLDSAWVAANYKESQLTFIRPGQQVEFKVDMYPGRVFKGTVESIMAGTGAAFSLLPPENASGNYVKVVQRIPVKITIDEKTDPEHVLRVGMSVEPTIHTGRSIADIFKGIF